MTARQILVSGSSSGIGHALCEHLLNTGHIVIGVSRRTPESLIEHSNYQHLNIDLSQEADVNTALKPITQLAPELSAVISNAGGGKFGALENFSPAQITEQMQTNLLSHMWLARALLPLLKRQSASHLIFMGSESALRGGRFGSVYSAAKFGLRGFAQALRHECAQRHVGVTCINPGMVRSEFFDTLDFQPGPDDTHALSCQDVVRSVDYVLSSPPQCVVDEINLSPLKHVVQKSPKPH